VSKRRFGSIRKLPSGRYQARYSGPDGRAHAAPDTFPTKTDAARWLSGVEADFSRGVWLNPDHGRETLASFADRWMRSHTSLRPRTRELYQSLLRLHVLPQLGTIEVGRLTPSTVRSWHSALVARSPTATTPAKAYRLLRAMLNTAVADEVILRNPCQVKGAGLERSPERKPPSLDTALLIAEEVDPRFRVLVLMAAFVGCRWGELVALRRHRINMLAGTLDIVEQYVETDGGRLLLGPPKSEAGARTIAIPPNLLPTIANHLDEFSEPGATGLVFVGAKGAPLVRRNFSAKWRKAVNAVGAEGVHFHDMRHLAATLAAAVPGTSTRDLMNRIGHSSPRWLVSFAAWRRFSFLIVWEAGWVLGVER